MATYSYIGSALESSVYGIISRNAKLFNWLRPRDEVKHLVAEKGGGHGVPALREVGVSARRDALLEELARDAVAAGLHALELALLPLVHRHRAHETAAEEESIETRTANLAEASVS